MTHSNTKPRSDQLLTHAYSHITQVVAAMDSCFGLPFSLIFYPTAMPCWCGPTRLKQLSMAATARLIWLCACVKYWPDRQSRPQSPRYPCPAERENEDLWEDAFELGISLAVNWACAVLPEVYKHFVPRFPILSRARWMCKLWVRSLQARTLHGVLNCLCFDI